LQAHFYLIAALLASGIPSRCLAQDQRPTHVEQSSGLFSPDPENIWNRLYRQIHVRYAHDGTEYGFADLDPLLWSETKYLIDEGGDSNKRTLDLLDQFLNTRAEQQIRDPMRRAIFQRDLWSVFDWASSPNLANRLGQVIWRLALSRPEINALPDTYAIAIHRKEFPVAYDVARPDRAFLPPDLFDAHGPWVCVGASEGKSKLAAPGHDSEFNGRSVFLVFVKLPGGRQATLAYLKQLANLDTAAPQFPANTEFALVRKMFLPDQNHDIVLTPVTESVQIRHYRNILFQSVSEIKLDRAKLFMGNRSGLRAVTPEDKEFPVFMTHGFDPFEENVGPLGFPEASLNACAGCHRGSGIQSMLSFSARGGRNPQLAETTLANEVEKVIAWKHAAPSWTRLVQFATGESRIRPNEH
jgi:hypothetical protein